MMRTLATLLVLMIGLTGCLESVEPEPVFRFDGITEQGEPGWEHLFFEAVFVWYQNQQIMVVAAGVQGDVFNPGEQAPPVRAWGVHSGTCDSGGPIVGQDLPSYYPNLNVNVQGDAISQSSFNAVIDVTATFHAKLHLSPDDDTVIACVNLTQVTG